MKRAPLLVAAGLAIGACAPSPPPLHVPGPTTSHPLASTEPRAASAPSLGPQIVVKREADARVVALRVAFTSGSVDDPPGEEGLTRLTAMTMTRGGTASLTYGELTDKLYPLAATVDVHVDRDETVFSSTVAADALESFYPLFEEILLAPRLDEASFSRLRAQAKSELVDELRGSNDEAFSKEALAAFIYDGHPYGHPPVGTERGLAAATLDEVRAQRARAFCAGRALVGILGAVPAGFEERLSHDFARLPACAAARPDLPPAPKVEGGLHVLLVDKPSADSTAIAMGAPVDYTRSSLDFPAMEFFFDYVGLHRQSVGRLFHELRERRGLNYGDYAYAEYYEQDSGVRFALPNLVRRQQMMSLWVRPVRPRNAAFALRDALHVYDDAVDRGVARADLERFRSFLVRYFSLAGMTAARRLGHALDDVLYGAKAPYVTGLLEGWGALDEATLKAAVDRHLKGKGLWVAIVTPNAAALSAQLTGRDPTPPSYDTPKPPDVMQEDKLIAASPLKIAPASVRIVQSTDLFK